MNKATTLTSQDLQYKAQAQSYLTEARLNLRHLAAERQREQRRRIKRPSLVSEVKAILQGV